LLSDTSFELDAVYPAAQEKKSSSIPIKLNSQVPCLSATIALPMNRPSTAEETVLTLDVSSFAYASAQTPTMTLPSFSLRRGEIVVLTGRSGCGKSTLLHLATAVLALAAHQGSVRVGNVELAGLSQRERDRLRPHTIGWIPQRVHLISALSVFDNAMLPIVLGTGLSDRDRETLGARARALLREAGIESITDASASDVSVGQASRVCAVRALVANPTLMCADEPSAALDRASAETLARMFGRYAREGGAALIASHDATFSEMLARESSQVRVLPMDAL
jgi:putative ABC transport system ATP-binding protein